MAMLSSTSISRSRPGLEIFEAIKAVDPSHTRYLSSASTTAANAAVERPRNRARRSTTCSSRSF